MYLVHWWFEHLRYSSTHTKSRVPSFHFQIIINSNRVLAHIYRGIIGICYVELLLNWPTWFTLKWMSVFCLVYHFSVHITHKRKLWRPFLDWLPVTCFIFFNIYGIQIAFMYSMINKANYYRKQFSLYISFFQHPSLTSILATVITLYLDLCFIKHFSRNKYEVSTLV